MTKTQGQKIDEIWNAVMDMQKQAAARAHFDEDVVELKNTIDGNGRPGFKAIRDKVLKWDAWITSLSLLVAGDIVLRVVFFFSGK